MYVGLYGALPAATVGVKLAEAGAMGWDTLETPCWPTAGANCAHIELAELDPADSKVRSSRRSIDSRRKLMREQGSFLPWRALFLACLEILLSVNALRERD